MRKGHTPDGWVETGYKGGRPGLGKSIIAE